MHFVIKEIDKEGFESWLSLFSFSKRYLKAKLVLVYKTPTDLYWFFLQQKYEDNPFMSLTSVILHLTIHSTHPKDQPRKIRTSSLLTYLPTNATVRVTSLINKIAFGWNAQNPRCK